MSSQPPISPLINNGNATAVEPESKRARWEGSDQQTTTEAAEDEDGSAAAPVVSPHAYPNLPETARQEQLEADLRNEDYLFEAMQDAALMQFNPFDNGNGILPEIGFRVVGNRFLHEGIDLREYGINDYVVENIRNKYLVKEGIPDVHKLTVEKRRMLELWVRGHCVSDGKYHRYAREAATDEKGNKYRFHRIDGTSALQALEDGCYKGKPVRVEHHGRVHVLLGGKPVTHLRNLPEPVPLEEFRVKPRAEPLLMVFPRHYERNKVLAIQMWVATCPAPLRANYTHQYLDWLRSEDVVVPATEGRRTKYKKLNETEAFNLLRQYYAGDPIELNNSDGTRLLPSRTSREPVDRITVAELRILLHREPRRIQFIDGTDEKIKAALLMWIACCPSPLNRPSTTGRATGDTCVGALVAAMESTLNDRQIHCD